MDSLLTKHLDIWSAAKAPKAAGGRGRGRKANGAVSPHGIKKLRELILELAVRGKLVPQNPDDEPASVLLENIAAEKARLIKEKKIKKQKTLPEISEEEKPFALPQGWKWVRLQQIIQISSGDSLTTANMNKEGKIPVFGGNGITGYHDKANINKPTLVIGRVGYYCGSVHLTPYSAWITDNAFETIFSEQSLYIHFLSWLLKGTNLKENESATAQPVISGRKIYPIVVSLPPLAEQHRIVTKVDELMALCDRLEQQQSDNNATHQTLLATLLTSLTTAADHTDFTETWQRIQSHFHTLFTTEDSIDQLKQTILQLTVMGKLVPQNSDDEPASVLLEKIAAEKARLIKEKKIKKQKKLPEITEEEKPFDLPEGWEWSGLSGLLVVVTDGDHQAPPKSDSGVPFLVIGNLNSGKVIFDDCKYVLDDYYQNLDWIRKPVEGDILYTVTGSYGIPIPVDTAESFCVQRHVAILKAAFSTPKEYLTLVLSSKYAFDYATSIATGIAQKTVPLTGLRKMPIPLPPLAEQHRIVAKVDELMALCDTLKARLSESQTTQIHLADAMVEQAVNREAEWR